MLLPLLSQWEAIKSNRLEGPVDTNGQLRLQGWDLDRLETWKVSSLARLQKRAEIENAIAEYLEKELSENEF